MLRTFSFTAILALVASFFAGGVAAIMAQGSIDLTRDALVQYSTSHFADTEAFCKKFRSECVSYVGAIGQYGSHHQLDCLFQTASSEKVQTGNRLHAFCGGLAKNPDGTWTNGDTITDYTEAMIEAKFAKRATVKGGPISLAACKKFAKTHDNITCSSASQ
ncbi:hypothetical protein JCM11641_005185 [Rhodosporidiobolus odoratus]